MLLTDTVVILPTYNEAENLRILLPQLKQYNIDILVVDDSPELETAEVAIDSGVKVIRRNSKAGRTSAILDGIASTQHSKIITMDADLQHPAEVIPNVLIALNSHDIVVASRKVGQGGYAHFPLRRRLISSTASLLALPLVPHLKDRTSGFVAFKRSVLNGAKLPLGFSTLTLSIFIFGKYNTFIEVPYTFQERQNGTSKLKVSTIFNHLGQLGKLYLYKIQRSIK